jgi:hypothetical protein
LSVRDFRLDVASDRLSAEDVGLLLVGHLGLLMVDQVSVRGLRFLAEAHKGRAAPCRRPHRHPRLDPPPGWST